MMTTYSYRRNIGIIPLIIKTATAVMFGIVLFRTNDFMMNAAVIAICAAYFAYSIFTFIKGLKNRPLAISYDKKGLEFRSSANALRCSWHDIKLVKEYYVPAQRGAGYFRIDVLLNDGGLIWFTNNILLSNPPKRESENYTNLKQILAKKVSREKLKFQVTEL